MRKGLLVILLTSTLSNAYAVCTHVKPTFTITPTSASIPAGSNQNYTLAIRNNDTIDCTASTFSVFAEAETVWLRASLSTLSLSIQPQQTGTLTFSLLASKAAVPGTYLVNISETNKDVPGMTVTLKAVLVVTNSSTATTGLTPTQIQLAYGINNLPFQGEGQTIAIVSAYDYPNAETDLGVFSTTFNLPACTTANGCFKKIYAKGTVPKVSATWGAEMAADLQWAHAMAPNAKLILVESPDASIQALMNAVTVATQNGANVVSIGWGLMEYAGEIGWDTNFKVPGTTFVAAVSSTGNGMLYPSASPYVLSVGGTSLQIDSTGSYLGESAWSQSGGGLSLFELEPTYQSNFPIPNNTTAKRGTPDVAFHADNVNGYSVYNTSGFSGWIVIGGTNIAAAQWAGYVAVINSASHKTLASMNTLFYNAALNAYTTNYNQILTGNNGTCGYYCTAREGYNYITGLGTPQAQFLAYDVLVNG